VVIIVKFSIPLFSCIFLGGGVGATVRWVLSALIVSSTSRLWTGTLFVNILGCLIFFLLAKFLQFDSKILEMSVKTGFLGSLTTFSTFSYEVVFLLREGRFSEAIMVCTLNVFLGVVIGIWILR
jgi:CrcB protein